MANEESSSPFAQSPIKLMKVRHELMSTEWTRRRQKGRIEHVERGDPIRVPGWPRPRRDCR